MEPLGTSEGSCNLKGSGGERREPSLWSPRLQSAFRQLGEMDNSQEESALSDNLAMQLWLKIHCGNGK